MHCDIKALAARSSASVRDQRHRDEEAYLTDQDAPHPAVAGSCRIMRTKLFGTGSSMTLADNRIVRVVVSTQDKDRGGEVVVIRGLDLSEYRRNPCILWQHNPASPVARCIEIAPIDDYRLEALAQFPPAGTSALSDEVYGLIKAGVVNAASIGWAPTTKQPMDPKNPRGPQRYLSGILYEFSFVTIPANPNALIVERSLQTPAQRAARAKRLRDLDVMRLRTVQLNTAAPAPRAAKTVSCPVLGDYASAAHYRDALRAYEMAQTARVSGLTLRSDLTDKVATERRLEMVAELAPRR